MLDQISDVFRNSTLAELSGDTIGAACIAIIFVGAMLSPLVLP